MVPEAHDTRDWFPGLAPFLTFEKGSIHRALLSIARATKLSASITFDPERGIFAFHFKEQDSSFEVHPWMLLNDVDRRHTLQPMPKELRDPVADAILVAWQWMIEDLRTAVADGEMHVVAREDTPLARTLTILPEGAWSTFDMIDWEHGVAVCRFSGAKLFDVRFRPAVQPTLCEPKTELVTIRRGRRSKSDWPAIEALVEAEIDAKGWPDDEGPEGWRGQADVERFVFDALQDRQTTASESTVRRHTSGLLAKLRPTKARK